MQNLKNTGSPSNFISADFLEKIQPDLSEDLQRYLNAALPRYESDLRLIDSYQKKGELLELGSYPYCMSCFLEKLGFSVAGLDLKISRANQLLQKRKLKILECDIEQEAFPFESSSFDWILLNEVIEHLRINPLYTLSEINRCLKTDGLLMLTTPNLYGITMLLRFLSGKGIEDPVAAFEKLSVTGHMGHLRTFARHDVEKFLSKSGFRVVRFLTRPLLTGKPSKIFRKKIIYKFIPPSFHDNLIFIAQKVER